MSNGRSEKRGLLQSLSINIFQRSTTGLSPLNVSRPRAQMGSRRLICSAERDEGRRSSCGTW